MKHKVTLPDGRRMMEGWTEEKTTGRMFGCVNSADGVELLAPLSRNVFKNVLTLFKYRQSHKMFPSYSKTPSHILSFQSVLAHLEDVLTCLTCCHFPKNVARAGRRWWCSWEMSSFWETTAFVLRGRQNQHNMKTP